MNKRLLWLIVIIILLLSSFNVVPQIKHSLSKKKSTKEEIIAVNKKIEEVKADIEKYDKKIASLDDEFRKFLDDMVETMYETDGVGLAAPQVGVSKRVFVCDDGNGVVRKVINPIVVPLTEETQEFEEGCLSVPGIYKKVERPKRVLLKYLNENAEEVEEIAENFLAVVVQHENDHLDGILFVEKISPMAKRLIAKKLANMKKETKRMKEENE